MQMQMQMQMQRDRMLTLRGTEPEQQLYCGNGNFSLPLASIFRAVLATELDKWSVRAATACAKEAEVSNLKVSPPVSCPHWPNRLSLWRARAATVRQFEANSRLAKAAQSP